VRRENIRRITYTICSLWVFRAEGRKKEKVLARQKKLWDEGEGEGEGEGEREGEGKRGCFLNLGAQILQLFKVVCSIQHSSHFCS
jgi:hypothetical protein